MPAELQSAFLMKSLSDYFYLFFLVLTLSRGLWQWNSPFFSVVRQLVLIREKNYFTWHCSTPQYTAMGKRGKPYNLLEPWLTIALRLWITHPLLPLACYQTDSPLSQPCCILITINHRPVTSHIYMFFFSFYQTVHISRIGTESLTQLFKSSKLNTVPGKG